MSEIQSCSEGKYCINSIENKGESAAKCILCRLAPDNENLSGHYWKTLPNEKYVHPVLFAEKRKASINRLFVSKQARQSKDIAKRKVSRKAVLAEKETEKVFIRSTKNSGRSNRDGDSVLANFITIDTKMQSKAVHPIVRMDELDKVSRDAKNGGNNIGCLCIRNKYRVGIIVLKEEDFGKIVKGIINV
jgi:K+/H+ antiporter YhaU regulatory subunit KhtT